MNDLDLIKITLANIEAALWRIEKRQQHLDPNLERLKEAEQNLQARPYQGDYFKTIKDHEREGKG